MERGVPLVIGGRLPVDERAHRAGEPDLLVRSDAFALGTDQPRVPACRDQAPRSPAEQEEGGCPRRRHVGARWPSSPAPPARTPSSNPSGAGPTSSSSPTTSACSRRAGMPPRLGRWAGIVGARGWSSGTTSTNPGGDLTEYFDDPPSRLLSTMEAYGMEFDSPHRGRRRIGRPPGGSGLPPSGRAHRRVRLRRVRVAGVVLRTDGGDGRPQPSAGHHAGETAQVPRPWGDHAAHVGLLGAGHRSTRRREGGPELPRRQGARCRPVDAE